MMVVGVPAIIAAGAWFAGRVIAATDENTRATIELKQAFKSLVEIQLPGIASTLNGRSRAGGRLRTRITRNFR